MKRLFCWMLGLLLILGACVSVIQPVQAEEEYLPYIGMPEKEIRWTSLGRPTRSVFQRSIWRDRKDATVYYWENSKGKAYFVVTVTDGIVTAVSDKRETLKELQRTRTEQKKKYQEERRDYSEYDPYEARSFANAEDFYDEYRDDFFDYEDAEDYWDEYGADDW